MLKIDSLNNSRLFVSTRTQFLILFLTLFSLLFVFSTYIFSEQIFIGLQRKYIAPQIEKKFGFRGRRELINVGQYQYEAFSIASVEPGGLFEQAGFQAGDAPRFYGCRFFVIGKPDEAMFYSQLHAMKEGNIGVFTVTRMENYRNYLHGKGSGFIPDKRIYLLNDYLECANAR